MADLLHHADNEIFFLDFVGFNSLVVLQDLACVRRLANIVNVSDTRVNQLLGLDVMFLRLLDLLFHFQYLHQ